MSEIDTYEEDCEDVKEDNKKLMTEFRASLEAANLSQNVIDNHLSNIDFYINEFLLYESAVEAKDGISDVNMFLGYWFIKKAMWASQSSIKSNAATLKKFYAFMHVKGFISREALNHLRLVIKERMPEWLATLRRYDDLSVEDVW